MQDEKLNSWRKKLEDAENLQHTVLQHKDAAWEKLHSRLTDKPKRKFPFWYWVAAACIAALIITIGLLHNENIHGEFVKNNSVTNQPKQEGVKKEEQQQFSNNKTNTFVQQPVTVKKKVITNKSEKKVDEVMIDTASAGLPTTTNAALVMQEKSVTPAIADTTTIAANVQIPGKKKLKVVHINELGDPVEMPATIAAGTDIHLFQFKLAKQEIYTLPTFATAKKPLISFKPKSSTN